MTEQPLKDKNSLRVGYYASILMFIFTFITFGFAMIAVPVSGNNCQDNCISYPYVDSIIEQFPRDYIWMMFAIILSLIFTIFIVAASAYADKNAKIFGQIALSFGIMSSLALIINYYLQVSIIQPSLESSETEGLVLLTQYNSNGVFIALEEIGFALMSLSLFFLAPVFQSKLIKWVFFLNLPLVILAYLLTLLMQGIDQKDTFEVIAISVNWVTLLLTAIPLSRIFKKELEKHQS